MLLKGKFLCRFIVPVPELHRNDLTSAEVIEGDDDHGADVVENNRWAKKRSAVRAEVTFCFIPSDWCTLIAYHQDSLKDMLVSDLVSDAADCISQRTHSARQAAF
jgi:hypothetical protein